MGLSATTSGAATQLGFAMMPLCPWMAASFTSGTTSGTSGNIRKYEELSTTTAPASTAAGAKSRERPPPAENRAIWMPSKLSSVRVCTVNGLPR